MLNEAPLILKKKLLTFLITDLINLNSLIFLEEHIVILALQLLTLFTLLRLLNYLEYKLKSLKVVNVCFLFT